MENIRLSGKQQNVHIRYERDFAGYHRIVADLTLELTPANGRVIDIGCGVGHILSLLKQANKPLRLYGVDQDERCLELTQSRVPDIVCFAISGIEFDLTGVGKGYNCCIMCHVLEHLPKPLEAIQRVLDLLEY